MKYVLPLCLALVLWGCETPEPAERPAEAPDTMAADYALEPPPDAPNFTVAGLEEAEVSAFFETLKQAVARDDRRKVASLVAYPITVQLDGQPTTLKDTAEFVARYPDLLNEHVKAAVQAAEVNRLFVNWQGVRVGRGEIWFGGVYEGDEAQQTYGIKIVAINTEG